MPDYFSHSAVATQAYNNLNESLKQKIISPTLFLLGAQGGDIFYTCNMGLKCGNLGKILHKQSPARIFKILAGKNKSYAAGFATHYALDSTFHPIIYAFERGKIAPLAHFNFEADLGLYICSRLNYTRKILQKDAVLGCAYAVYDSVKDICDGITATSVEKCLKKHCNSIALLYKMRRACYRYDLDYKKFAPVLNRAISLAEKAIECVLCENIDERIFNKDFLNKSLNINDYY